MRFHYDQKEDAFYIRFDESPYSESEEVQEGVIFDFSKKGEMIGLEVLDASKKLSAQFKSALIKNKLPLQVSTEGSTAS